MSSLRYLCLLAFSGVQHIWCCVFVFGFLRFVYPMLPVSLDSPFLIAPSVFSSVYLHVRLYRSSLMNTNHLHCQ
jgi:hypothetical protein